jgi:hypothetical protein
MTFPKDDNIVKASVSLVAATLNSVECLIGFYIKHQCASTFLGNITGQSRFIIISSQMSQVIRGLSAVFSGDEYQQALVLSLEQIKANSQGLIHQARNSDMHQNKQTLDAVTQGK